MVADIKTLKIKPWLLAIMIIIVSLMIGAQPSIGKTVFADDSVQASLRAEDQTIHRGQTFDVDVELNDNEGILTLFLTIKFDHSVFTLTNVQQIREALGSLNMEHSGSGYDYVDDRTVGKREKRRKASRLLRYPQNRRRKIRIFALR